MTLYLFFLPLVFAAVIKLNNSPKRNQVDRIFGSGIIQGDLFGFLRFPELIRFIYTCSEYSKILDKEYEKVLSEIPFTNIPYKECDKDMKAEIRRLYKYYMIEMPRIDSKENFSFPLFLSIINGRYLKLENSFQIIKNDNLRSLKSKFGYIIDERIDYESPNFPQISLSLLKSGNPLEMTIIQNACFAPQLYDAFFKHLAKNFHDVERDALVQRIMKEYPYINNPSNLIYHELFIKGAFDYAILEIFVLTTLPIFIALSFTGFGINDFADAVIDILLCAGIKAIIRRIYHEKYENFEECDKAVLRRCNFILKCTIIVNSYFKWLDEDF